MVKIVQIDLEKEARTGKKDMKNVLREIAKPVKASEFGTSELQKILDDMSSALKKEFDGIAIAAPQIGISKRIFIVSPEAYEQAKDLKIKPLVFINPKIIKKSRKTMEVDEGCLSVRPWYGTMKRARNVTLEFQDFKGQKFVMGSGGLLAHIFQHEYDHLDGILFTDHAKNLQEIDLAEEERLYKLEQEKLKNEKNVSTK